MHKIIFFSRKKICVPTLPKNFRPVTLNTLIFFIWPYLDVCFVDPSLYFQQVLDMLNSLGVDNVSQQKVGNKNKIVRVSRIFSLHSGKSTTIRESNHGSVY